MNNTFDNETKQARVISAALQRRPELGPTGRTFSALPQAPPRWQRGASYSAVKKDQQWETTISQRKEENAPK